MDDERAVTAALSRAPEIEGDNGATTDPRLRPAYLWLRSPRPTLAPLAVLVRDDRQRLAGVVFAREECTRGFRAGLLKLGDASGDNLVLARPGAAAEVVRVALNRLVALRRVHSFVINVRSDASGLAGVVAALPNARIAWGSYTSRSRMPLPATLEDLVLRFVRHSRRNLRVYPARAERAGIQFRSALDAATFLAAFESVRQQCDYWNGFDPNAMLDGQPEALRAGLVSAAGEWLGVVAGWRYGDRAFVAVQLNHRGYRDASLSIVQRVRLIEHSDRGRRARAGVHGRLRGTHALRLPRRAGDPRGGGAAHAGDDVGQTRRA